jgi:hypothetical protein
MARATDDMPAAEGAIFEIADATRAGMHLLIQLFGPSECGKTLSGLYLACGIARALAGPKAKVGVMDTEGRARMFADKIPGSFKVGELTRPFSPRRYLEGIELFMEYGIDALMIDSFSHVWEGIGGVLDQAEQNEMSGSKGLQKWNKPKRDYNRMVSMLLTTRIPLIFCSRAKQPIKIETERKNGREVEKWTPQPWEPIQDKRLKFDMTVVLAMTHHGNYETDLERMKCPDGLRHLFLGDKLTIETGEQIGSWVAGGEPINHAYELLRKEAFDAAAKGLSGLRAFYTRLPEPQRIVLRPMIANLQSAARAADEEAEQQRQGNDEAGRTAAAEQRLKDPFADVEDDRSGAADELADPFAYGGSSDSGAGDSAGLAVPTRKLPGGEPNWEETVADMLVVIAGLTEPADTAGNGRFKRDNREVLDRMREADRDAWSTVERRLGDRDRELREQQQ